MRSFVLLPQLQTAPSLSLSLPPLVLPEEHGHKKTEPLQRNLQETPPSLSPSNLMMAHAKNHLFLPAIITVLMMMMSARGATTIAANRTVSSSSSSPSSPPSSPPSPSSSSSSSSSEGGGGEQLDNIIDALIGSGDFAVWANVLSAAGPSALPMTATLFIPGDGSLTRLPAAPPLNFDPFILPYHVVPQQRLDFAELQKLPLYSRLPTLLPNNSILLTNNSRSNFTLDGSPLSFPDLYVSAAFSVHGVASILDYSLYGTRRPFAPPPPAADNHEHPSPPPPPPSLNLPEGDLIGGGRIISDAPRPCRGGVLTAAVGLAWVRRMRIV